jgi:hypothetical protein
VTRIKRSVGSPKTFSALPGLAFGALLSGGRENTFWHGSEIACLEAIWNEYVENDRQPWTVRHYMYVLKNSGLLKTATDRYPHSATNADNWVSVLLANARESYYWGADSWRLVADTAVVRRRYFHSGSFRQRIERIPHVVYNPNRWRGQQTRVVLCTEKEGLFSFLWNIANDYGVDVLAFGGNESVTVKHDAALEWQALLDKGQNVQLLYVGDLDPGGIDIERDFYQALLRYGYRGLPPVRIAVMPDHVTEIAPESEQPITMENTKAAAFLQDYPQLRHGYQVEGLPGRRLRELVENAIRTYIDIDAMYDAIRLGNAVGDWLTEKVQEAIRLYERDYLLLSLHETILTTDALIDPRTCEPFPEDLVRQYLTESVDDE